MGNTGFKRFSTLEEYYLDDNSGTGVSKANDINDVDYIAPVYDPSSCMPDLRFYNQLRTASANKNNCGSGYLGSSVEMKAMPGQFVSNISLDDANDKADIWLIENKQAHANLTGTCIAVSYYPISGCYLDATGADGASVCAAGWGSEILYSTSSGEGWEIGDYVYRDLGQTGVGPYEIVTSTTGYEVFISYPRLGGRSYVGLDVDMNTVYTIGNCAILQDTIIYTMNPRIIGFNVILDLTATRNLTSNVTIYVNVHGQWGGATAGASLTFNMSNGMNQYNNYLFNIEEYEGFFEDEPITVSVTDWDPRYDSYSRYDVG